MDRRLTAERIEKHIIALGHSLDIVNNVIASSNNDKQSIDDVFRNYSHIETMLNIPEISEALANKAVFEKAVMDGKAFISSNE